LTSRKSPTSRVGSIEPVGIWKACTTKVMTKKTKTAVSTMSSKYSRITFLSFLLKDRNFLFSRYGEFPIINIALG